MCTVGSWALGSLRQGGGGANSSLFVGGARELPAAAACPSALQLLLKDPAPAVRMKAAETLGRLVKFA